MVRQTETKVEKKSLESIASIKKRVLGLFQIPKRLRSPALEEYLNGQRQDRIVKCWVRRVDLDLRAIESRWSKAPRDQCATLLSLIVIETLVVRSLEEDSLGTVQRDIPRVLEALCSYLTAAEDARKELENLVKPELTDDKRVEIARGLETLEPLHQGKSR